MVVGVLLSLVVGDGLFKLALWVSVMVEGRLSVGMGWYVRVCRRFADLDGVAG